MIRERDDMGDRLNENKLQQQKPKNGPKIKALARLDYLFRLIIYSLYRHHHQRLYSMYIHDPSESLRDKTKIKRAARNERERNNKSMPKKKEIRE